MGTFIFLYRDRNIYAERKNETMSEAFKIEDIFAENVFTVAKMKERLPKKVFANLKNVMTVDSSPSRTLTLLQKQ